MPVPSGERRLPVGGGGAGEAAPGHREDGPLWGLRLRGAGEGAGGSSFPAPSPGHVSRPAGLAGALRVLSPGRGAVSDEQRPARGSLSVGADGGGSSGAFPSPCPRSPFAHPARVCTTRCAGCCSLCLPSAPCLRQISTLTLPTKVCWRMP